MSEINKINLKALKENYMRKPGDIKKTDDIKNEIVKVEEKKVAPIIKKNISLKSNKNIDNKENKKVDDKELFIKYESFFKKKEEKIQEKLYLNNPKSNYKNKKIIISIFAILLLIIPAYFIYSWWNFDLIKANIFWTKNEKIVKNNEKITINKVTNTNTANIKEVDILPKIEEILREKEKFNIWWYIFNIETELNTKWEKKFFYKSKEFENKKELRKWLEKEINNLKRKKLIKLLLEEKKIEELEKEVIE